MFSADPVQGAFPDFEFVFSPGELEEMFSFLDSGVQANSTSSSETGRPVYSVEERKLRRMISNRKSAQRSRWRKKRHLENLTDEVKQLRVVNRELKNRVCSVSHQFYLAHRENHRLQTEALVLQQRLSGLCQILDMQLQ
ncbi:hypothetical protein NMG60_11016558 [Bertholletia excelsa]